MMTVGCFGKVNSSREMAMMIGEAAVGAIWRTAAKREGAFVVTREAKGDFQLKSL
jgi:hypothetical protein